MKKGLSLLLATLLALSVLTACDGGGEETHTHTFAAEWLSDDTNHWHPATCEHTDEVSDKAAHVDANNDDICDVCSYAKDHTHTYDTTKWTWDENNHYHAGNCGHEVKQDEAAHVDENNDGLCDVCAYDYGHTHTYAEAWDYDKDNHWHKPDCGHDVANSDTAAHIDENNDGLCDVCTYDYDHEHTYAEAWESDDVYHWHKASCGHDVISERLQHKDDNKDAYCDDCNRLVGEIITYTATIVGNEFVTLVDPTIVTANKGAEVVFTFTASVMVAIDAVENAEPVGEPVEADGIRTYTYRIAALQADTTVTVKAHRISNAEVIIPDGKLTLVAERVGYVKETIELDIAEPGHYIIYSPNSGIKFELVGNPLEQNSEAISYEFDVAEAGKVTLVCTYFAWGKETVEVNYVVTKVENTNDLNFLEGSGYELPTNTNITVNFTVPEAGLWQITSSVPVSYDGDVTTPHVFVVNEGELDRTVVLHYVNADDSIFIFDWKISKVGGVPKPVTEGENAVYAPLNDYTAITFTPKTSDAYHFVTSSDAIYLYEWIDSTNYSYMSGLGSEFVTETLEAGKTYTYYVSVYKYGQETVTDDIEGTLTITNVGYVQGMTQNDSNTQSGYAQVGRPNTFFSEFDVAVEFDISVENGQISLDGGITWSTTVNVTVDEGGFLTYLVKGDDEAVSSLRITFTRVVYSAGLTIGTNTVTFIPGKEYTLILSGSSDAFYSNYIMTWDNADVVVMYKGEVLTSGTTISQYNADYGSVTLINNSGAEVTVTFTLTDAA